MKIAITGATGLVGRFIAEAVLTAGDEVTSFSRNPPRAGFFSATIRHVPFELGGVVPNLAGYDALVHAAFLHAPGRYRGGEGDDPDGFRQANLDGTLDLFDAARRDGVGRVLFLSSRAVYGDYPPGTRLYEDMPPRPDTLYGEVKWAAEQALAAQHAPGFAAASLRATGVYGPAGPGQRHKWHDLFRRFLAGEEIPPRVATEVHGADLAAAVRLLLSSPPETLGGGAFNLSDLILDRHKLLSEVARLTGCNSLIPPPAEAGRVSEMDCQRLRGLGWSPGGLARLRQSLPAMLTPLD